MTIFSSITNSLKLMRANKMRTGLTLLGLVIGIMTVIIVFSAGEGIRGLVMGQIESFGTDFVQTEIRVPTNKAGAAGENESASALANGVQVTSMTVEDMEAIEKLPNIGKGYAGILAQEPVSYANELSQASLLGASATYIDIDAGTEIAEGRFFTEIEDKNLASVVVLGSGIKEKLFGQSDALGKSIRIRNERFTVIGVAAERGSVFFIDFDDYLYVPIQTLQKKVMGINHVLYMVHQLEDVSRGEATAEDIRYTMRERHDITDPIKDDFRVTTMEESMEIIGTITSALTFLLLAIVAISLVVGGVGIMNVMYVAVTERMMEIGLRKAVGATRGNIMRQFLIEALLLTVLGGVVGCILGSLISYGISVAANAFGFEWRFAIPPHAFVIALSFSAFFGIVFGVTPARAAAKLDPIEALRAE